MRRSWVQIDKLFGPEEVCLTSFLSLFNANGVCTENIITGSQGTPSKSLKLRLSVGFATFTRILATFTRNFASSLGALHREKQGKCGRLGGDDLVLLLLAFFVRGLQGLQN